ncbi:LysR family transcriptional regulator [Evansella clarkii]|uniref:LysR family transcriptional regulator n=1 Tax=Evansella clarkii TaxID=79879 RepID=UPI0009975C22|nr:LysR family transcriptional regulator [Evansella clarkii]
MDIKQLKYFYTIAQEGQITRAAKRLHMAQPPLSQQLKLLEQELGTPLLERYGKRMELTEAGKVLFLKAEKILQLVEDTACEVKEVSEGIRGIISIGSVKTCFSFLPERIRSFRDDFPEVTFQLREGDTFHISELVRTREVELGLVRLPLDSSEDFIVMPLPDEPYVFVYSNEFFTQTEDSAATVESPSLPFTSSSSEETIRMKDLESVPLLLLRRVNGVGQFELIVNECRKHGFEPNIICECPDAAMILSLVSAKAGAAVLPKSTLNFFPSENLRYKVITDSDVVSKSAVIWLKDRYLSKGAKYFLKMFENTGAGV